MPRTYEVGVVGEREEKEDATREAMEHEQKEAGMSWECQWGSTKQARLADLAPIAKVDS